MFVKELFNEVNSNLDFPDDQGHFYPDYQNGVRGYNTDPLRGADTFHPFSSSNFETLYSKETDSLYSFYPSLITTINSGSHTKLFIIVGGYLWYESDASYIKIDNINVVTKRSAASYGLMVADIDVSANTDYSLIIGGIVSTCECMVFGY